MKPRIHRTWDARKGRFIWVCEPMPEGKWGMGVSHEVRAIWNQAWRWCYQQNAKGLL